ncbi:MAG TPA: hypothetical protein VHN14_15985 [Kofleriaceae bacterium]|jgi:hypothetical protein|nr:hypothetical protein [Kofleriaceae bacterium]
MQVAIEAKAIPRVTGDDLKGLRQLAVDHSRAGRQLVVCLETKPRRTDEGIAILRAAEFVAELASGEPFGNG